MADDPRQPVAVRVSRPYADEAEYLERELEMITRTSVVLVGAQSRPQGVILRFELALSNGTVLIRGEGRVVAYKERALGELSGLTLRFTRLDARSKALIDRAAGLREARARAALQESMSDSVLPSAPPAPALDASLSPAFPVVSAIPSLGPDARSRVAPAATPRDMSPLPPPVLPELELATPRPPSPAAAASPSAVAVPRPPAAARSGGPVTPSGDREPLLQRLRARAGGLSAADVEAILAQRRR